MEYFFYGTLMDNAVLEMVIGRRVARSVRRPAMVSGYRRVYRENAWFPVLVPDADGRVEGALVSGITSADAACLLAFEGDEYELAEIEVTLVGGSVACARVFLPVSGVPHSSREWTLEDWRRKHRREYLRRTRTSAPRGGGWS